VCTITKLYAAYINEKTEGEIKNGQSRDTGNIGHKTHNDDKQNKNTTQKN